MKPELSRKLDEELRAMQEKGDDMCDHPINRLHGLNGVYYCDKCRTSFHFDNSDQPKQSVTDEEIEAWAESQVAFLRINSTCSNRSIESQKENYIFAAKAMRDGQIPKK